MFKHEDWQKLNIKKNVGLKSNYVSNFHPLEVMSRGSETQLQDNLAGKGFKVICLVYKHSGLFYPLLADNRVSPKIHIC